MNLSRNSFLATLATLTITALATNTAQAQTSFVTASAITSAQAFGPTRFIGYEFTVASSFQISALGFIDATNSGTPLSAANGVGLYSVSAGGAPKTGTHVASVVIPAGTPVTPGAFGVRGVYFANISTITLNPGRYLMMGATDGTGTNVGSFLNINSANMSFSAGGAAYGSVSFFTGNNGFPGVGNNISVSNQNAAPWVSAVFGLAAVSSAPEPGTLALLALGGTLVLVRRRRK